MLTPCTKILTLYQCRIISDSGDLGTAPGVQDLHVINRGLQGHETAAKGREKGSEFLERYFWARSPSQNHR